MSGLPDPSAAVGGGDDPEGAAAAAEAATAATAAGAGAGGDDHGTLLVSEFPPPPDYFRRCFAGAVDAAAAGAGAAPGLRAPPVPTGALERNAVYANAASARARKEAERLRGGKDGGGEEVPEAVLPGDVLAVFGEIVEDPNLVVDPGGDIDDGGPAATRSRMRSLNREVMVQFLDLVNKLVKDPTKNKESREELGRLLADMVEECNRYRDHQARELLIERLEQEQNVRKAMLEQLRKELRLAAESSLN